MFMLLCILFSLSFVEISAFAQRSMRVTMPQIAKMQNKSNLKMNFFEDAFRFFSNMNKEASAKHILIKGPDASNKLNILKDELKGAENLSVAFSELASKVFLFTCI
jgi:hypothetical protein